MCVCFRELVWVLWVHNDTAAPDPDPKPDSNLLWSEEGKERGEALNPNPHP